MSSEQRLREALERLSKELHVYAGKQGLGSPRLQHALSEADMALASTPVQQGAFDARKLVRQLRRSLHGVTDRAMVDATVAGALEGAFAAGQASQPPVQDFALPEQRPLTDAEQASLRKMYEKLYKPPVQQAGPFAYACPANCGCIWRDNGDGTMSLFGKRSQSCEVCEPLPLSKLIPLYGAPAWKCKANRSAGPPQDCDWPTCGCDPHADKVIEALQESGHLVQQAGARTVTGEMVRQAHMESCKCEPLWLSTADKIAEKLNRQLAAAPSPAQPIGEQVERVKGSPLYEKVYESLSIAARDLNGGEYKHFIEHVMMPCVLGTIHRFEAAEHREAPAGERHGYDCTKVIHRPDRTGYLHEALDDTPYDIDGVMYCGRCHTALPARAEGEKS